MKNKKEKVKECSLCFGVGLCNCSTTGFNLPDNIDTCSRCLGSGYEPKQPYSYMKKEKKDKIEKLVYKKKCNCDQCKSDMILGDKINEIISWINKNG